MQMRPEMAEEGYRARISADEARKALIGLLPGVNLETGLNYDSNRFLLNNTWASAGVNVAFNLVKAFSLPAVRRSEEAQRRADEARRQAMAMAVLAQTRLAAVRYALVADEFLIWDEAARDDDLIVQHLASGEKVGIDNELELIRARARAMASHINRDLAYANVQAGIARLFNSVGYDAVPQEDEAKAVAELSDLVELRFNELERASFSPRAAAVRPSAAVAEIAGATPRTAALLREGVERVLASAGMVAAGRPADVQLQLHLFVDTPTDGRRVARVAIVARPGPGGATLLREFKTSLSDPVDDEQWRVLGEGAAYRVLGEISAIRVTRPALRVAQSLRSSIKQMRRPPGNGRAAPDFDGGRLGLRLDPQLGAESPQALSVSN
ncbi:MAG: TolC family protein [Betaproteobacteria bacterium]|nr:MAG: TolC family protein [Betaproteobacteria bacterium]